MPNRIYFFSDIDDTLIQTKRKTDFSQSTVVASYNKGGEESSFFYEGVKIFVDTIINSGISFIPTTARNFDSYKRTIFFNNPKIKNAILNFGGLILVDNKVDQNWEKRIKEKYTHILPLTNISNLLLEILDKNNLDLEIKIIDNYYISIYNRNSLDNIEILKKIINTLTQFINRYPEFYLYQNGNSFGILPNFLNKKFAVEYLIIKYKPIMSIGAGDNKSDLDFMKLTTFKMMPKILHPEGQ